MSDQSNPEFTVPVRRKARDVELMRRRVGRRARAALAAVCGASLLLASTRDARPTAIEEFEGTDGPAIGLLDSLACGTVKFKGVIKTFTGEKAKVTAATPKEVDPEAEDQPTGVLYVASATPGVEFARLHLPYVNCFANNLEKRATIKGLGSSTDDGGGFIVAAPIAPVNDVKASINDSVLVRAPLPMFGGIGDGESVSLAKIAVFSLLAGDYDDDPEGADFSGSVLDTRGLDELGIEITKAGVVGVVKSSPDFADFRCRLVLKFEGQLNYDGESDRPSVAFRGKVVIKFKSNEPAASFPLEVFERT